MHQSGNGRVPRFLVQQLDCRPTEGKVRLNFQLLLPMALLQVIVNAYLSIKAHVGAALSWKRPSLFPTSISTLTQFHYIDFTYLGYFNFTFRAKNDGTISIVA